MQLRALRRRGEPYAHLFLWIGLALMLSGLFASFTEAGSQFIYLGTVCALLGMVLKPSLSVLLQGALVLFIGWGLVIVIWLVSITL
jgi:hypothetical protein